MLIELCSILIPVFWIFFYAGTLHKQMEKEFKEQLLLHEAVSSYLVQDTCPLKTGCTENELKVGQKIIYIRKPKGRLEENAQNDKEDKGLFSGLIDNIEKKAKDYSNGEKTANL